MRGAKCVLSLMTDPPKPTLTYSFIGNHFFRSHCTMLELPAKNTAPGLGGLSLSRFSMAAMFFSHFANGSATRGGGATGGCTAATKTSESMAGHPDFWSRQ